MRSAHYANYILEEDKRTTKGFKEGCTQNGNREMRGGEDIDRFIALKVFNCDNLYMFHCSRNAQATFKEKPQLKIY